MKNDKTITLSRNKLIVVAILIIVGFIGGFFHLGCYFIQG